MFLINYLYLTVDIPLYKRDTFIKALAAMPNSVLQSALDAKQADHECIALQLALTKAEIKSFKRHLAFLSIMHSQHVEAHTISKAHIDILDQILGGRCIGIATSNQVQRQQQRDEPVRENTHLLLDTLASRLRSYHLIVGVESLVFQVIRTQYIYCIFRVLFIRVDETISKGQKSPRKEPMMKGREHIVQ